jgi:hypothetical protein
VKEVKEEDGNLQDNKMAIVENTIIVKFVASKKSERITE